MTAVPTAADHVAHLARRDLLAHGADLTDELVTRSARVVDAREELILSDAVPVGVRRRDQLGDEKDEELSYSRAGDTTSLHLDDDLHRSQVLSSGHLDLLQLELTASVQELERLKVRGELVVVLALSVVGVVHDADE